MEPSSFLVDKNIGQAFKTHQTRRGGLRGLGESEGDMGVMDDIGNQILHAFLWRLVEVLG